MCHQVLISYRLRSISSLESREYELRECIPHTRACFWNVILKQIFLRMDVIGSFMTRDVFVEAPSVSGLTESVTFVDESESCQREVVTNSSERVDFPSLFTVTCPTTGQRCPSELLAGELCICSSSKWIVLVLGNQETIACNKCPVYQHPVLVQQQ